ncbi:hypothetical protein [Promicromonospora sp. NPDC023987]|uniref:hypothetical protein n=1 Tax=Promicromonospora sp. NPDC023987 TaxID=3155360 RepID=UPI0033E7A2DC
MASYEAPNERQVEVLKWIGEGCPPREWPDFTHKTSALALQNRGLASVSKKGGVWSAQITDAGERLLAGEAYESVRPARKKTNARQATNKELRRGSGQAQPDADARRRRSIASAFLKRIDEAAGVLFIEEPSAEDRAEVRQGISAAEATGTVPTGKVLRAVGVRAGPLTVKLVAYAPVDAHISPRQYDVLAWIAEGCPDGRYEDVSHRQTARLLHGRGLVQVAGRGDTWTAHITDRGQQVLVHQKDRVDQERSIQERQARQADARRQRDAQDVELAKALVAELSEAGDRVDVGHRYSPGLHRIVGLITSEGLVATGRRVVFEPTMMDERLGYTVYFAPDFDVQIEARAVPVPAQLRLASSAVIAFRDRRDRVSKSAIPRAARILQAIVDAVQERSWSATTFDRGYRIQGRDAHEFDLTLGLGRLERHVVIWERNGKARGGPAFVEQSTYPYDWRSHGETKVVRNRDFEQTGELILRMNKDRGDDRYRGSDSVWQDSKSRTLESQLPEVLRLLDIAAAQADWERSELQRRQVLVEQRWTQIRAQAVQDYSYDERVQQLEDELARWDSAQQMRAYSDAILFTSSSGRSNSRIEARAWAEWIRVHADNIDPLKGPLRPPSVPDVSDADLKDYLHGWSPYGPRDGFGSRSPWS